MEVPQGGVKLWSLDVVIILLQTASTLRKCSASRNSFLFLSIITRFVCWYTKELPKRPGMPLKVPQVMLLQDYLGKNIPFSHLFFKQNNS